MKDRCANARWGAVLGAGVLLVHAASAHAQLGARINRPSWFVTPSTTLTIGGPYTRADLSPRSFTPTPESAPLAVGQDSWMKYRPGLGSSAAGGSMAYQVGPSLLNFAPQTPMIKPLATPIAAPWARPLAVQMPSSVPQYEPVYIPDRIRSFEPTVNPDSFIRPTAREPTQLKDIAPSGPSAGALQSKEKPFPAEQVLPGVAALQEFSQRRAAKLSDEGAACLQKAMQALKDGHLRSDLTRPGAIDLFKRARLLAGQQPEPTLGLIAALVSTADYNQAAVLVGPLVRTWPEVLARTDFADKYYARPEQIRADLLAIRDAVAVRGDADLRLLWAFYRWYAENKRQAMAEVDRLSWSMGPDSAAAAMAAAMRATIASGG